MDLLIETGKFAEAAHVYKEIKRLEFFFIIRNPCVSTLYAIALYKQVSTR